MNIKTIAKNPTAYHNYIIEDKIETGIVLSGTEIKSIRNGKINLKDTYAQIKNGEIFVIGMHISPYEHGNIFNKDPLRNRKLLLNKREINKIIGWIYICNAKIFNGNAIVAHTSSHLLALKNFLWIH